MAVELVRECVSVAEARSGMLQPQKLARLKQGWLECGLAILTNVIPQDALDAIETRLDFDAAHRYVHGDIFKTGTPKCTDADYFQKGGDRNFQLGLPRHGEHFVREIWANPIIEQVAASLLGGDCYIRYINGNTSCPGNTPQGLHVDSLGTKHTKLAVNFGTEDICAENGSTFVWPGTHHLSEELVDGVVTPRSLDFSKGEGKAMLDARRDAGLGPVQLDIPKGAVCLRDLRVWHAAAPNHTELPRHMLYLSYNSDPSRDPFANSSQLGDGAVPLQFSESSRAAFDAPPAPGVVALGACVNRNVSFTPFEYADHYGNIEDEPQWMAPQPDAEGNVNPRFTYWLPDTKQPLAPPDFGAELPKWVVAVAQGRRLRRPEHRFPLPDWAMPTEGDARL